MRVLQINTVNGTGSTGRIALDLSKVLKENGHECMMAYGRGTCNNNEESIRIGSEVDNIVHAISTRIFDKHGFYSRNATKKFIKKIEEYNPDIIHLHNLHGYYINIELLFNYLKKVQKPVIWTLHDCWAFTGHCAYFDYVKCYKWENTCYECQQKIMYPTSWILDNSKWSFGKKKDLFTGINNMSIVTPSNWLLDLTKSSFLNIYNVEVIHNGIDLDLFKPTLGDLRERYKLNNKFIILGVANGWDERKGYKYFLELSKKLDINYHIILVGVTKQQQKELPFNILGITRTNNIEELAQIYSIADVFINPTLEDNFPTTNLEALACGTPVITFCTGGSVESIDEKCGIVVEKGNLDGLLKSISDIKNEKFSLLNCTNRAKLYDKNDRYRDYIKLYQKNLEERK